MTHYKLFRNARIATFSGSDLWGWIEHGAIVTRGETVLWVGETNNLPAEYVASIDEELGTSPGCRYTRQAPSRAHQFRPPNLKRLSEAQRRTRLVTPEHC